MKTAIDWLNETTQIRRGFPNGDLILQEVKIIERLAELIAVNSGTTSINPNTLNQTQPGVGIYGRVGLTLGEALELVNLNGMLSGIIEVYDNDDIKHEVFNLIKAEIISKKLHGFDPKKNVIEQGNIRDHIQLIQTYSEDEMKSFVSTSTIVGKELTNDSRTSR